MKVVQINAVCDTGSTGRICRELNEAVIRHGYKGIVLYGNGSSNYQFAYGVSGKYGVKCHGLLSRILGKNAAYSPFSTKKIVNILKIYKPDIVHLHNLHGNYVNLKPLLEYLSEEDIPTVLTLHDCWFFTGKCTHYTTIGCTRWQTGCHHCPQLKENIPSWFFDRTGEMWQEKKRLFAAIPRLAVIGVSDWITNEAKQSFLNDAVILKRIHNWIDLSVFYPRGKEFAGAFGISEDKYSILCIGSGWSKKNDKTKYLLQLAQMLPKNYEIILAGTVPFADHLPENIKTVGYISSAEELAKLYSACDVYVHLSREDTFGKVIAEAIACGTPAVVFDSTACPEIVGDGCGQVVPAGDLGAMLHAAISIAEQDKTAWERICVTYAAEQFSKDKLIEETMQLYQQVINQEV